jgi:hypothetical protein
MNDALEIFIADQDQPFTCPYDGARTEMVGASGFLHIEQCPCCMRTIYFEFDREQNNDNDI